MATQLLPTLHPWFIPWYVMKSLQQRIYYMVTLIYPLCLPKFNFVLLTLYRPLVDHRLYTFGKYLIFTSMKRYGFQQVFFRFTRIVL